MTARRAATPRPSSPAPQSVAARRRRARRAAQRDALLRVPQQEARVRALGACSCFLVLAIVGPMLTDARSVRVRRTRPASRPRREYWLGTTAPGQDVFTQFVYGLRASFIVGAVAGVRGRGSSGWRSASPAGYRGGVVDDILSMLTNVVLVIPTIAVLIIVAAYLSVGSLLCGGGADRRHLLAVGGARDPGADVLARDRATSSASRGSRGQGSWQIIVREIAPNMSSYLFLTFILLFGGSILIAATLDFLGLGPSQVMSLGLMMNMAVSRARSSSGCGGGSSRRASAITAIVAGLYVMNVGLDEVFNPRLRRDDEPRGRQPARLLPHAARRRAGASTASPSRSPTARSWASPASRAAASRRSARA